MNSELLIKDLLKQEENEQLEFKEVVRKDAIGKTICGFLNNNGGQLLIGVTNNKEIRGVDDADKICTDIELYLLEEIVPEAPVMVSVEIYKDKKLLLLKVWEGSKQPYIFKGSIYYRRSDKTIQASSREISELIHKRQETEIHWERQAALGVKLEDLDIEELEKTFETMRFDLKLKSEKFEPREFLSHYGLYQDGNFTNAAVLLFANHPTRFIPQARVRIAFLTKGKTGDVYEDDRLLEGNIFKNRIAILDFFDKHLHLRRKFDYNDWTREDDYEIPMKALREGVMNSLVHREYSSPSSALSILVYPDKVEISNTGKSPYKQKELLKSHLSMPYNPDIAHIVFLRGLIEKIGRGTIMIADECKIAGLKAPVWDIGHQTVKLTFFRDIKTEGVVEGVVEGAIEGAIEGAFKGATKGVKEKLTKLLKAIVIYEGKRVPDYTLITDLKGSSMERYIRQLRDGGLIEYKGDASHTGGYYLTGYMNRLLDAYDLLYRYKISKEELDIVKMLAMGLVLSDISKKLNLRVSSIEKVIASLKSKFNASNSTQLIKILSDVKLI
ncbi:RNA-binding domain-containing protein [Flavobacterium anhuiense]|uniref:RNA-binding domain-containing protein n=1 Tax=Flavobacterium anhuiense TaxID=459526 RepID=UPI0013C4D5F4|nr:RNA-binding domain-containing protein [Flavobacterium anhuiense]